MDKTAETQGYYKRLKEKGETVYIDSMDYTELEVLTEFDVKKRFRSLEETEQKEKLHREQDNVLEYSLDNTGISSTVEVSFGKKEFYGKSRIQGEDTIMNRIARWDFTREQKDEMHKMMAIGMSKEEILSIFYPETEVAKMREIRRTYRAVKNQNQNTAG